MNKQLMMLFAWIVFATSLSAEQRVGNGGVRFGVVDIFVDAEEPFAAWQFELTEHRGQMTIVGIENGSSVAYSDAPFYDREAIRLGTADWVVVADFSLAPSASLPSGKTRIASIHVRLSGSAKPDYEVRLMALADASGQPVDAQISIEIPAGRKQ